MSSGQAEKEFRVEVEAIGHVRHKNLVRLLGYCVEGTHRYIYIYIYQLLLIGTFTDQCISLIISDKLLKLERRGFVDW